MSEIGGVITIVVVVPDSDQAVVAARTLVEQGVALLELDGGPGNSDTVRIIDVIGGEVPVGAVVFGAESLVQAARRQALPGGLPGSDRRPFRPEQRRDSRASSSRIHWWRLW